MNQREIFLTYIAGQGWTLDPTVTRRANRHSDTKVQDPYAFSRPAAGGGTWHAYLDYQVRNSSNWRGEWDNTLRGITLHYSGPEPRVPSTNRLRWKFFNPATASSMESTSHLWDVTRLDGENPHLRTQAKRLMANPDLAVWLAEERIELARRKQAEADAKRQAEYRARRRPITDVTVDMDTWRSNARALISAARSLEYADGTSDVHALMTELHNALATVEASIEKKAGK